ncbi:MULTISPECIES: hypothetical protein [Helicobacter]|nr:MULTISPECIES: hypothetical protein [Helicobacter]
MIEVSVARQFGDTQVALPENTEFVATAVMDNALSLVNSIDQAQRKAC